MRAVNFRMILFIRTNVQNIWLPGAIGTIVFVTVGIKVTFGLAVKYISIRKSSSEHKYTQFTNTPEDINKVHTHRV